MSSYAVHGAARTRHGLAAVVTYNAARIVEHRPSSADGRPAITRSELCARVADATALSKADAAAAAGAMF